MKSKITSIMLILVMTVTLFGIQETTTEAKTFKKTGTYSTSLSKTKDSSNKFYSYAKKLVFKGNKIILYGSMHYTKPGNQYSTKIYKPAKRTFVISKKCKFVKSTAKSNKNINKKTLKKLALPLDSGNFTTRMLGWQIKGGKVVKLIYSQY